jgi:hypothetical protein
MSYDKPEMLTTYSVTELFAGASGFASGSTGGACDGGSDTIFNQYFSGCAGFDNIWW